MGSNLQKKIGLILLVSRVLEKHQTQKGFALFMVPLTWWRGRDPRPVCTKGASRWRSLESLLLLLTPGLFILLGFQSLPVLVLWLHSWAVVDLCVPWQGLTS